MCKYIYIYIDVPTTFRPISGFALLSIIHSNQPLLYRFPIFETSATALCGSSWYYIHLFIHMHIPTQNTYTYLSIYLSIYLYIYIYMYLNISQFTAPQTWISFFWCGKLQL